MGTPTKIEASIPPGVDCPACTPSPFPSGTTPSALFAVIHNVTACPFWPAPPNGIRIRCPQVVLHPCLYHAGFTFATNYYVFDIDLSITQFRLLLPDPVPIEVFLGTAAVGTFGPFSNSLSCPGAAGYGGSGYILGPVPAEITELAFTMNLQPDAAGLYDMFDGSESGHKIVRLTGRDSPGSCLIDYEPP